MYSTTKEYASAFMNELCQGSGYNFNTLRNLVQHIDIQTFITLSEHIAKHESDDIMGQFIYFLTIFREEPVIHELIASDSMPLAILEHLVLSSYTNSFYRTEDGMYGLNKLLGCLSQHTYLRLLNNSKLIRSDVLLRYSITVKLDRKHIDDFFNTCDNLREFIEGLLRLPAKIRFRFYSENVEFYGYVQLFAETLELEHSESLLWGTDDAEEDLQTIKQTIVEIFDNFNIEKDAHLAFKNRNFQRYAFIVKSLYKHKNRENIMRMMESEGVIIDSVEKSLISEILYNPVLRQLLRRYCGKCKETS